ncbi:MAG TPA: hypothetical protein PLF40_15365 [Kofleriaceae bacterium]|nr:hypothetical protein [Kofleriaceae bacterium]
MKNLKYGILGLGVLGLLACFLPFVSFGDQSMSFFGMRKAVAGQVYITMAGFILAAVMGGMGLKQLLKWQAGAAAAGFAFVLFKLRDGITDLLKHGAIGAKLMVVAAVAGLVVSILAAVKGTEE